MEYTRCVRVHSAIYSNYHRCIQLQIPETPLWLLSKGREEDALKSLQWLRGWTPPQAVAKEFQQLQRYSVNSGSCNPCVKQKLICTHPPPTFRQKLGEITRKRTLKPLLLILLIFLIAQFSGLYAMRPFITLIIQAYGVPIKPSLATVWIGFVGLLANVILLCVVRTVGKRRVYLLSMIGTFTCCISLGECLNDCFVFLWAADWLSILNFCSDLWLFVFAIRLARSHGSTRHWTGWPRQCRAARSYHWSVILHESGCWRHSMDASQRGISVQVSAVPSQPIDYIRSTL